MRIKKDGTLSDNARDIVRNLVDARLQGTESLHGAAGILATRGQSIAQRALRTQQALQKKGGPGGGLPGGPPPPPPGGLQSLQAKAKHKTIPSNKPSWATAKYLGRKALSYHSPVGVGVVAGLDALVPGLGVVARAVQQTFGDQIIEDTSQSSVPGASLLGYHKGFWNVGSGPNQPTMSIPSHQVYGHDGVTKIIGKPGLKGKIVKTKKGHAFHSTDDDGPVSNPVGGKLVIGVDYGR